MSETIDVFSLKQKIRAEAARVIAKANRWAAMAEKFKRNRMAFLRPAKGMKRDAERVILALDATYDPYTLAILLDEMLSYTLGD